MTRGKGKASVQAADTPVTDPPASSVDVSPPAELRGEDSRGNVRPADNRYLTEAEIAARDEYVAEVTGPEAQQLLAKAEAPEHVEAMNSRDRTAED